MVAESAVPHCMEFARSSTSDVRRQRDHKPGSEQHGGLTQYKA